jgi:hypothetical protein
MRFILQAMSSYIIACRVQVIMNLRIMERVATSGRASLNDLLKLDYLLIAMAVDDLSTTLRADFDVA